MLNNLGPREHALLQEVLKGLQGCAMDADKWITVHPNGPDHTGRPALIGENGEVKGGMGGKFNGEKISEARASFSGPKSGEHRKREAEKAKQSPKKAAKPLTESERNQIMKSHIMWERHGQPTMNRAEWKDLARSGKLDHLQDEHKAAEAEAAAAEKAKKREKNDAWREKHLPRLIAQKATRIEAAKKSALEADKFREQARRNDEAREKQAMAEYAKHLEARAAERLAQHNAPPAKMEMPKTGRINEDDPAVYGSHLLGWEGELWEKFHASKGMDETLPVTAMDDSARVLDTNGWYEVAGNPLSKVGVFPYRGSQIPGAPDPDRVYQVLRPEEELNHPDCIASFRLLPWIDNHVMLGSEEDGLTPADRKGIHGVIGEQVEFRDGVLYGNIKVFSQSLASAIENGKRELSCGYRCRYDPMTGVHNGTAYDYVQRDIRGNHLALVQSGRMGPDVAVLDSNDPVQQPKGADMADEMKDGGGSDELSLASALEAIKGIMPAIQLVMAAAGGGATPPAAVDATPPEDGDAPPADEPDGDEKKEATGMDSKPAPTLRDFMAQIAARDKLARSLSEHVGTFDHSLMTESDVAAYGVQKLGITAPKGAEVATLTGFLAGAVAPRKQPVSGMDAAVTKTSGLVSSYINGKKGA